MKHLPGYIAVILIGVMFAAGQVIPAVKPGPQEMARVMVLYEEAMVLLDADQPDLALQRFQDALEVDKAHVLSYVGMGHAYLQKEDLDAAEDAFRAALKKDKKFAPALNGMGLVYRERPKELRRAIRYFRDAVRADKASAEAQYDLAQTYQRFGSSETLKAYREVLKIDPQHPDAWFQIGRIYELDGKLEDAEQALRKQVAIEENHYEALLHLGIVLKRMNRVADAVDVLDRGVGQPNPFQRRSVLELADVFQQGREYDRSQALFERYIHSLEPSEQVLYYDLSLVASGDLVDQLKGAPLEQVKEVAKTFWSSLDPAPVTAANERLIEHFRRVAVASEHMGVYKKPWDDRGEVYIRYGEPDHVSRSGDIRFETDTRVVMVKERLVARAGEAGAILAQDRDASGFSSTSRLREEAGTQRRSQDQGGGTVASLGRGRQQEVRSNEKIAVASILGWPVYPVDGVWEYWIYTNVGQGIEITFVQRSSPGPYEYAELPPGTGRIAQIWQEMNPAIVMRKQAVQTPATYRPTFATGPLDFHFYAAAFQGEGDQTALEIYYGIPTRGLSYTAEPGGGQVANLVRGVAIYDADNQPVRRISQEMVLRAGGAVDTSAGSFVPEMDRIELPPGEYRVDVQVQDRTSGKTQVYRMDRRVNSYGDDALVLSDIELAARIDVADRGRFLKGDIEVIPMASLAYRAGDPVFIYYEIYNLKLDEFGATRYRISYEVRSLERKSVGARILGGLGKLLGQNDEGGVITIEYEQLGQQQDEQAYLELDMSSSEPGRQLLKIQVTDTHSGQTSAAAITFTIQE